MKHFFKFSPLLLVGLIGCQSTSSTSNDSALNTSARVNVSAEEMEKQLILTPKPIVRIEPKYPFQAANDKVEGWVYLSFDINEIGGVSNVEVINSYPANVFDKEAAKALKKWKYKPFITNGKSVAKSGLKEMLVFSLSDKRKVSPIAQLEAERKAKLEAEQAAKMERIKAERARIAKMEKEALEAKRSPYQKATISELPEANVIASCEELSAIETEDLQKGEFEKTAEFNKRKKDYYQGHFAKYQGQQLYIDNSHLGQYGKLVQYDADRERWEVYLPFDDRFGIVKKNLSESKYIAKDKYGDEFEATFRVREYCNFASKVEIKDRIYVDMDIERAKKLDKKLFSVMHYFELTYAKDGKPWDIINGDNYPTRGYPIRSKSKEFWIPVKINATVISYGDEVLKTVFVD